MSSFGRVLLRGFGASVSVNRATAISSTQLSYLWSVVWLTIVVTLRYVQCVMENSSSGSPVIKNDLFWSLHWSLCLPINVSAYLSVYLYLHSSIGISISLTLCASARISPHTKHKQTRMFCVYVLM